MRWTAALGLVSSLAASAAWAATTADVPRPAFASGGSIAIGAPDRALDARWTPDLRSEELGELDRGLAGAPARRAPAGGVTVIARGALSDPDAYDFPQVGFVWTRSTGMMLLGGWQPLDLAPDGSTLIGVWPDADPAPVLALASGGARSSASALSLDGRTIFGWGVRPLDTEEPRPTRLPFHGDPTHAWRSERDTGTMPDGRQAAWVAVVPEPAPATLAMLGLVALALRRHSV